MPCDFYLDIDGVPGESVDDVHKGKIDILSWSWGLSQPSNLSGGGSAQGKANWQDLHFTHQYDKSSPNLAKACAMGSHFKVVKFIARKQGEGAQEFFTMTLKEAFITSVQVSGGSGGDLQEQFSMSYKDIDIAYKAQDEKGGLGGELKFGYAVAANKHR
jgi:type VI secretion system secreted protein Hcp